jgi:GntR family transcriptional regulator/MocR family aminotransferase
MEEPMGQPTGIEIRPHSDEPLYRQLFDQVVARIRSGTFPPGFRLPPSRALAGELGTHRNTVVRAYEDLEAAGFVHSTVGRGTFVADPPAVEPSARPTGRVRGPLPWGTLVSTALGVEALGRSDRLPHGRAGRDLINIGRMLPSPDLLPNELFRRCIDHVLRTQGARALGYTPREGLARLREAVAADLHRQGVPAAAADILITTGSQQALDLAARALVNPGDAFLADESTYPGALNLLSVAGARLIGVPSDDEGPEIAALARYARSGAKGYYLMPNAQNPTGARISRARREALVAWSHEAGVPLIEDDYASDLDLDGQPPLPALRTLDGEVIYVGTYSKKLIPALRIGYLLCPPALQRHLLPLKQAMDLGSSGLLQHALAEFLERGYLRAHLGRVRAEYRRRRDALERALRRHLPAEVTWRHPEMGLVLWIPMPPGMDAEELYLEAQEQGVVVSPGNLNRVSAPQGGLRLTFCAEPPARLAEGARRLGRAWAAVERRARRRSSEPPAASAGA